MKSEGPPDKESEYAEFTREMLAAEGEWVELEISKTSRQNAYASVYSVLARTIAEVRVNDMTVYGRMRKSWK